MEIESVGAAGKSDTGRVKKYFRLEVNKISAVLYLVIAYVRTLICWFSVIFSSTANFVSLSRKNL